MDFHRYNEPESFCFKYVQLHNTSIHDMYLTPSKHKKNKNS